MKIFVTILASVIMLTGCFENEKSNDKPRYGKDTGLPTNCRALVQANIDGFRNGTYKANEIIDSLERNCGANGYTW